MTKDVNPDKYYTVAVEKLEKYRKVFSTSWNLPQKLSLNNVYINHFRYNYWSALRNKEEPPIFPIDWDITCYDGTELDELERAVLNMLSSFKSSKYDNLTLKISYEEFLGDFTIELVDNTAKKTLASHSKTAVAITVCPSLVRKESMFSEAGELSDLLVVVNGEETVENYNTTCFGTHISATKLLITNTPDVIEEIIGIAIGDQPSTVIGDLTNEEIALVLAARGRKIVPKYINGIEYIGKGQPRLKVGDYTLTFDGEEATKETHLAEVIFGKPRDLSETITYEEIFETLEGKNAPDDEMARIAGRKWIELEDKERKTCIKDYKQRMRQLNFRLGSMLGLGEEKALTSVEAGIAVNYKLLKP